MIGIGLGLGVTTLGNGGEAGTFYADFAGNDYRKDHAAITLADALSLTRSSTKWFDNIAGAWTEFPVNTPARSDKGASLGLASITNYALGGDFAGAVAGSPGTMPTKMAMSGLLGMTRTVALGTENGLPYLEVELSGTPNATSIINLDFVAFADAPATLLAERWTAGSRISLVSGTAPALSTLIQGRTAANANSDGPTPTAVTGLTATAQYKTSERTMNNGAGTTAKSISYLQWSTTNGVAFTSRIRIFAPFHVKSAPLIVPPIFPSGGAAGVLQIDVPSLLLPAAAIDLMLTLESGAYSVAFGKSGTYALAARDLPSPLNSPHVVLKKAQDLRRRAPPIYDNFAVQADGDLPGRVAKSGQVWQNIVGSGGALVNAQVASGILVSKVSGVSSPGTNCYSALVHTREISSMYGMIGFGAGTGTPGATLISTSAAGTVDAGILRGSIHIHFQAAAAFIQVFDPVNYPPGAAASDIGQFSYPVAMVQDGTLYLLGWRRVGTTLWVLGPDGVERSFTDPRFATVGGMVGVWEHSFPNVDGGARVRFGNVYAGDDVFQAIS